MACLDCTRLMWEMTSANAEMRMLIDESYIRATRPGHAPSPADPLLIVQTRLNGAINDWLQHCADGDHT